MNSFDEIKFFGFQWHITNFCNLRCRHCYQNDFTKDADLGFAEVRKIVKKIADKLTRAEILVNITGGEPLLHKDFFKIIDLIEMTGNIKGFNIITNGLLLTQKNVNKLKDYKKLRELKISLEAGNAELNDSIRGRGVFKKVLENVQNCNKEFNKEIVLMFTLSSYNYQDLPSMIRMAEELDADGVIIERFVPLGTGIQMKDEFLKPDEWQEVLRVIIDFSNLAVAPQELLPYKAFHVDLKKEKDVKGALCNLGDESMALMPNGDVYPCRRFPTKIGNLVNDDFGEILLRLRILRESLEKNLKGKCSRCNVSECIGCRALAYALTGDFYTEDPQCFL